MPRTAQQPHADPVHLGELDPLQGHEQLNASIQREPAAQRYPLNVGCAAATEFPAMRRQSG